MWPCRTWYSAAAPDACGRDSDRCRDYEQKLWIQPEMAVAHTAVGRREGLRSDVRAWSGLKVQTQGVGRGGHLSLLDPGAAAPRWAGLTVRDSPGPSRPDSQLPASLRRWLLCQLQRLAARPCVWMHERDAKNNVQAGTGKLNYERGWRGLIARPRAGAVCPRQCPSSHESSWLIHGWPPQTPAVGTGCWASWTFFPDPWSTPSPLALRPTLTDTAQGRLAGR